MSEDMRPIEPENLMNFNCSLKNRCFNECCRDLNQVLTPYDTLRLKKNLEISSQSFLKTYTSLHHGPESGLPVITFKPNPGTGHECPFVTAKGCKVYEDRPASCRMYPLARAIAKSRDTGEIVEYFALIEEPHCKGFETKSSQQQVQEWLKGQDVNKYNQENDKILELISLKNQILPGKLEGAGADQFYLALYNLDEFRAKIFNNDLLKPIILPDNLQEEIKKDDLALLNFGLIWIKHILFGIKITFGE